MLTLLKGLPSLLAVAILPMHSIPLNLHYVFPITYNFLTYCIFIVCFIMLIVCLPPLDSLSSAQIGILIGFIHRGIISLGNNAWLPVGRCPNSCKMNKLFSMPFLIHDMYGFLSYTTLWSTSDACHRSEKENRYAFYLQTLVQNMNILLHKGVLWRRKTDNFVLFRWQNQVLKYSK